MPQSAQPHSGIIQRAGDNRQPPTSEDLQFLEAAVRLYGDLCVKEANEP